MTLLPTRLVTAVDTTGGDMVDFRACLNATMLDLLPVAPLPLLRKLAFLSDKSLGKLLFELRVRIGWTNAVLGTGERGMELASLSVPLLSFGS